MAIVRLCEWCDGNEMYTILVLFQFMVVDWIFVLKHYFVTLFLFKFPRITSIFYAKASHCSVTIICYNCYIMKVIACYGMF